MSPVPSPRPASDTPSSGTTGRDPAHAVGAGEATARAKPRRRKAHRDGPPSAAGSPARTVDVADVGDALTGALRAVGTTTLWCLRMMASGTRHAATAIAHGLVVVWPTLAHVLPRLAWWGALALLFVSGGALLDTFAEGERLAWIPTTFVVGLALACVPAFMSSVAHLRAFGVTLAAAHASALLLVWMAQPV